MHFVVNQNHRPGAYACARAVAEAAGGTLLGQPGSGFLRLAVAVDDAEAVESLLTAEGLFFVKREAPTGVLA